MSLYMNAVAAERAAKIERDRMDHKAEIESLRQQLNKYSEDEMLCAWTTRIAELEHQLATQREAFAIVAETPVSGEQDDITMEAKDRIAKAIRAWEPK